MKPVGIFLLTTALCLLMSTDIAQARFVRNWSYQDLLDKSDLAVIATLTATNDTQERINFPGFPQEPVVGVETRFTVLAVLKGDKDVQRVVLHHYRTADGSNLPQSANGPTFVSFAPPKKTISNAGRETPPVWRTYILFLVRETDGRYAPVVGQTDPGSAFKELKGISGFELPFRNADGSEVRNSRASSEAERLVEQMRGISMKPPAAPRSDGTIDRGEQRRQEIVDGLRALGSDAVSALVHALKDSDAQMRRNAELVMISLAAPYEGKQRVDIEKALPALITETADPDADVRAWAAHAIAEIGPRAKAAVPSLIVLLKDPQEGPRNDSCIALGRIGPAASDALPALREALNDPSNDVRRFAKRAIELIQNKHVGNAQK